MPDTQGIAEDIYLEQQGIKQAEGKYKHKPFYEHQGLNLYTIKENEYICPDGSDGLDVMFIKTQNTKQHIEIISFGAEKLDREHDWEEVSENEY